MGEHVRYSEDTNGDLLAIHYFCSGGCWRDSFAPDRMGSADTESEAGGASPCASSELGTEQDVHCSECGVLMASPDKETPTVVNLIERPPMGPFGEAEAAIERIDR